VVAAAAARNGKDSETLPRPNRGEAASLVLVKTPMAKVKRRAIRHGRRSATSDRPALPVLHYGSSAVAPAQASPRT